MVTHQFDRDGRKDRPLYSWISHYSKFETKWVSSLSDLDGFATLLCWIPSVYDPHRGHCLVRHQPFDTQDSLFGMFHRLGKEPTPVCACMFDLTQHVEFVLLAPGTVLLLVPRTCLPPRAGDCLPVHRPHSLSCAFGILSVLANGEVATSHPKARLISSALFSGVEDLDLVTVAWSDAKADDFA